MNAAIRVGGASRDTRTLDNLTSRDEAMQQSLKLARLAARSDVPILLLGESGTGKTLLARAIHNSSRRAAGPFVSFNAAALSDTLLDSQLFGHEKGAFTGATRSVRGKFAAADNGTLLLDEIADMTLPAQAKILRAVEYGEFEALGSERLQTADVRVLSATHLPLAELAETDAFRTDLFYRLRGVAITIPPLRARPRDLRVLIAANLTDACRAERREMSGLEQDALDLLLGYPWPGNLRELTHVLRAVVAMTEGEVVERSTLELVLAATPPAEARSPATADGDDDLTLRGAERRHIDHVLRLTGGNKRRAARTLDVSRATLDRKLAR